MVLYEFSAPMPFEKKYIEEIVHINNSVSKSKITNFYFGLNATNELYTGYEQCRNKSFEHNDFAYWQNLMEYSLENNIDIIYCLNHPSPMQKSKEWNYSAVEKLTTLLEKFRSIGIDKLRITNPFLMLFVHTKFKDFKIYASTSLEYKTIQEYRNFVMMYPYVVQVVPSHDINKDFRLLGNIRKSMPDVEIELLTTQACLRGCPHRTDHQSNNSYGMRYCRELYQKDFALQICRANNIYPWDIEEYSKIGINKFKLVGRDDFPERTEELLNKYKLYLSGIDDYKNIENIPFNYLIHYTPIGTRFSENLKVGQIKPLLPKLEYFVKNGHLCHSDCNVNCRYCFECAEKINKMLSEI